MKSFDRFFGVIRNPWVILTYAICVFLVYQWADVPIAVYFHQFNFRNSAPILNILTALGKWKIYALILVLLGLFFHFIKKDKVHEQKTWFLLACVILPNLVGFVLKVTLSRSRPELFFDGNFFGFYWFKLNNLYWSFPSGHSITVGALAAGLGVLFPRYFYVFLSLAFLVVLTRVFLYFHYLSDVMTGFYLGLFIVGIFTESLKKRHCLTEVV